MRAVATGVRPASGSRPMYSHLLAKGINVEELTTAPYGMKQLFHRDPDGFGLCFQWKAPADSPAV